MFILAMQAAHKSAEAGSDHFGAKILLLLLAFSIFAVLDGLRRKN